MTKEEAIYRLKNAAWLGSDEDREATEQAVEMAVEALANKQEWTPVSDGLPNIKQHHTSNTCIVYCKNGAYGFTVLVENIFGQVGWDCEREDDYYEPLGEVLAWMPLPEPYKGSEEREVEK